MTLDDTTLPPRAVFENALARGPPHGNTNHERGRGFAASSPRRSRQTIAASDADPSAANRPLNVSASQGSDAPSTWLRCST